MRRLDFSTWYRKRVVEWSFVELQNHNQLPRWALFCHNFFPHYRKTSGFKQLNNVTSTDLNALAFHMQMTTTLNNPIKCMTMTMHLFDAWDSIFVFYYILHSWSYRSCFCFPLGLFCLNFSVRFFPLDSLMQSTGWIFSPLVKQW